MYVVYIHVYLSTLRHLVLEHGTEHRRARGQDDLVGLEQSATDRQDHVTEEPTLEQLAKILVECGLRHLVEETGDHLQ